MTDTMLNPIQAILSKKMREIETKLLDIEYDETYKLFQADFVRDGDTENVNKLNKIYAETKLARSKAEQGISPDDSA